MYKRQAWFLFGDVLEVSGKRFDVVSFVLSVFAFGGVTLGIGNVGSCGLADSRVLLPLAVGIVGSVIFASRQLRMSEAFLELKILKIREYALSVIGSMLLYFVMMGSSILMPLYVQSLSLIPI